MSFVDLDNFMMAFQFLIGISNIPGDSNMVTIYNSFQFLIGISNIIT